MAYRVRVLVSREQDSATSCRLHKSVVAMLTKCMVGKEIQTGVGCNSIVRLANIGSRPIVKFSLLLEQVTHIQ